MAVILAPSTQAVPNGYSSPPNVVATFVLNTGDELTWGVSGSQIGSGGGPSTHEFGYYLRRDVGAPPMQSPIVATMAPNWGTAEQRSFVATEPFGAMLTLQIGGNATTAPTGTAFGVFASTVTSPNAPCVHGTQKKIGIPDVITLTPDQILSLLSIGGWQWINNALAFLQFQNLSVEALCAGLPPPLPTIDTSTLSAGVETWTKIFHSIVWSQLCECVPGTPTPIPPRPPVGTQPTDWPAPIVFSCNPADICASLIAIQRTLAAILQNTGSSLELATLSQRYGLPFAYIRGARHSNLTGTGAFAIPRCIGFLVEVKAWPSENQSFSGAPAYITDLGWISTLDSSGMLDEVRLTRQAQTWLPRAGQEATTFGYALRENVVADVVELYAEP